MGKYLLKRIALALVILLGVSALIYMLTMLMPADYIDNQTSAALQSGAMTKEDVQRLKELYGLGDKSFTGIIKSYSTWLKSTLSGDLGFSFLYGKPVTKVLSEYIWISFMIAFISYILQIVIGIPMGIKASVNQYSPYDYTVSIFAMMGASLPSFFLSALLMNIFAIKLGIFPLQGLTTATKVFASNAHFQIFWDKAWHLILPISVLTLLGVGGTMKFTRTNMLEVLNSDYIRTARAKGLSEQTVTYKHAFRNTMIPLVTSLSGMLPGLFGGAMITETVFAIPGIGRLMLSSIQRRDYPVVQGILIIFASLCVVMNLLVDIIYVYLDPRIKYN